MELRKFKKKSLHNKFFLKYFLWYIVNNLFVNLFISRNKIIGYFLKLFETKIGNNTCVSEGIYIPTGTHDFKDEKFKLSLKDQVIGSNYWIAAKSNIELEFTILNDSFVKFGSITKKA
jgi:acetyltransferase-like isoleucine patch superfamily enzyme